MSSQLAVAESGLSLETTRTAVNVRGVALASLSFQALGICYAGLATSPLYALPGMWTASTPVPDEEEVIGVISTIIWALTLLPLIKYIFIALRFGTSEGEGGTFALFQGLFPQGQKDSDIVEKSSADIKISQKFKWPLLAWALFGTSLTLSDGILTPAVSVTSAVVGIAVRKPSIQDDIVPISIAFLITLSLVQFRGTAQLGFVFAPIMAVWLLLIAASGIVNIIAFPGIFRAFDPSRAIMVFVRTKNYDLLSGVLLALTGCEAMFANLGQFSQRSIQISFCLFVYPSLVLSYLGQGARIITDGEAVMSNIFYQTIPGSADGPLFWIIYVFAILSTLLASQTLITATFSLVQQLVNSHVLPRFRLKHTSETYQGQIFIPAINWILMIVIVIFVVSFKTSQALTNAFGFAVATVMFTTTTLIALQIRYAKKQPIVVAVGFFLIFGFLDGLFWGVALKKVPQGAWVPLMLGIVLVIFMLFWTWAKGLEDGYEGRNNVDLHRIILPQGDDADVVLRAGDITAVVRAHAGDAVDEKEDIDQIPPSSYVLEDDPGTQAPVEKIVLPRIPTCAIFHTSASENGVSHVFSGFIRHWPSLPRVVIFLSVRILSTARVPHIHRYSIVKDITIEGLYMVTYLIGFRDDFDLNVNELVDGICSHENKCDTRVSSATLAEIRHVCARYTHFVPQYHVVSERVSMGRLSGVVHWIRSFLIEDFYGRLATLFPESHNLVSPDDEVIRVGLTAKI